MSVEMEAWFAPVQVRTFGVEKHFPLRGMKPQFVHPVAYLMYRLGYLGY